MKKSNASEIERIKKEKIFYKILPFALIGVVCFCAYYLLNINTPLFGDDIYVLFKNFNMGPRSYDETAERVTRVSDIISNLARYYLGYRGRLTAEGLEMIFAVYGKQYFNFINAFIFTGLSYLVYYHGNYQKKDSWRLFLLVCVVFWFLTPNMTNSYLWMVCSFYTVWPMFFILLFLVPYRKLLSDRGAVKYPNYTAVFVAFAGIFAGSLSELSLGLSIGFVVLVMAIQLLRKKTIPMWSIMGLVSTILGTMIIFLSPGYNSSTLEKYSQSPIQLYFSELPSRLSGALYLSFRVTKLLLPVTVIVFIWLIIDIRKSPKLSKRKKKKDNQTGAMFSFKSFVEDRNGLLVSGLFFVVTGVSIVLTTALPYYEYRLFFTVFVCTVLVFFSLLSEATSRLEKSEGKLKSCFLNKYVLITVPVLISLITVFDFGKEFRIYHQHFKVYTSVTDSIRTEVATGQKDIVIRNETEIPQILFPEGRLRSIISNWSVTGLTGDTDAPLNRYYAYYFGADTIRGERKEHPTSKKDGIIANNY